MKNVVLTDKAQRQLDRMMPDIAHHITLKLEQYARDPNSLSNQVKWLKQFGCARLRVGDYRVLFNEDGFVLRVWKIGHRREVYH